MIMLGERGVSIGGMTSRQRLGRHGAGLPVVPDGQLADPTKIPLRIAARSLWNQEWFHDHVRIEHMLFDGAPAPHDGVIRADLSRPGLGLEFKHQDARRYAV